MTSPVQAATALAFDEDYRIAGIESVMTPALVIYPEIVDANITATLRLLGNDPNRWRPHVKTAKLGMVMRMLVGRGVTNFKCATTLELRTACEAGAKDVLIAYALVGANARRVQELARLFPDRRISALVENAEQVKVWAGSDVSLFIDINGGMDRTGIEQDHIIEVVHLARVIREAGLVFRGLHYYDGHMSRYDLPEREAEAHRGYDRLMRIVAALDDAGIAIEEVITAGTPAFPCTISYPAFANAPFVHRASPGTVVYGDFTSAGQLPAEYGYHPAVVVVSTVVSHPVAGRITCDAGHKAVSADAGVPTCAVLGRPELQPDHPSEEHLPINVPPGAEIPAVGEHLYLVPRHVCPTVNNFDYALLVAGGRISGVERVTARGREVPVTL
ncbi:MAG TPA: alanine racemase [Blastocatellia bacterium]|nr:alanine racemase [Blastocatellia bacterium]